MRSIKTNPIIFDIKYTPYRLKRGSPKDEVLRHREERSFYDLTGEKNVLKYITTEGKQSGKFTVLEYLQKSTGVFNGNGMIARENLEEMKSRVRENKSVIWHGFISLCEDDSSKIDSPDKCINLIKMTFKSFFEEARFNSENMDLICALHLDKPHHLHVHFVFWEKEPKLYDKHGNKVFRAKGNISKIAIDNMYLRIGEFLFDDKKDLYLKRVDALKELRELSTLRNINASDKAILNEVISLAKALPKMGRLSYGSKDMESYRGRVDKIVKMLLNSNEQALLANRGFYEKLETKKQLFNDIAKTNHLNIDGNVFIEEIEKDYKRRQGNLVLNLAKIIKPEIYERSRFKKYKANDNNLKRRLSMSRKKIDSLFKKFLGSFGSESEQMQRDFSGRLKEIEEEMEREREVENNKEEFYRY